MRRIATIGIACMLVALSGAAVALASSGSGRDHAEDSTTHTTGTTTNPGSTIRSHKIEGRVTAVDATAKTFDLKARRHHHRSRTVTITVTDATVYKRLANGFASVAADQRIKAKVRKSGGILTASRVELKRSHHSSSSSNDERANHDANDDNGVDGANHDVGDDHGGNSGHGGHGNDD